MACSKSGPARYDDRAIDLTAEVLGALVQPPGAIVRLSDDQLTQGATMAARRIVRLTSAAFILPLAACAATNAPLVAPTVAVSVTDTPSSGACPAATDMTPTNDVQQAFEAHCVVRPLAVGDLATFAPSQAAPPVGSLDDATALLSTEDRAFYSSRNGQPGVVLQIEAAFSTAVVSGELPGAAKGGYNGADAWVLAWKTQPTAASCPYPGDDAIRAFNALPPLGVQKDWHFLVVPSDGTPPLAIEPTWDFCEHRYPAHATAVFRHVLPAVSASGDYTDYDCVDGQSGSDGISIAGDHQPPTIEAVVGVPVDPTLCRPKTSNIGSGWEKGAKPAAPESLSGWPAGVARP
jgi:hypothetical protein